MVILDKRETTAILEQKQNLHCHYSWLEQTMQTTKYPTARHKVPHALCYLLSKFQNPGHWQMCLTVLHKQCCQLHNPISVFDSFGLLNLITFATAKYAVNINPATGIRYCINNINPYSTKICQADFLPHSAKLLIFNPDHATLKISRLEQPVPFVYYDSDALH